MNVRILWDGMQDAFEEALGPIRVGLALYCGEIHQVAVKSPVERGYHVFQIIGIELFKDVHPSEL